MRKLTNESWLWGDERESLLEDEVEGMGLVLTEPLRTRDDRLVLLEFGTVNHLNLDPIKELPQSVEEDLRNTVSSQGSIE